MISYNRPDRVYPIFMLSADQAVQVPNSYLHAKY